LDKTLAWTASHIAEWYDVRAPELYGDEASVAASVLWALRGDAGQRALVAWSMGWTDAQQTAGTTWMVPFLAELLTDPYDAVRLMADRSLRTVPGFAQLRYDFMSSSDEREAAKREVLRTWENQSSRRDPPSSELLLDGDGLPQRARIERLIRDRDTRPVNLAE
jgi:hypothetical protein